MTEENSIDVLLKEAQKPKSASAKPSKTRTSSERESSPRSSGDVQPGTTTKTTITGAARLPSATRTEQSKTTGELGLAELNHTVQKFGFINRVDNVNWPPYRDSKT